MTLEPQYVDDEFDDRDMSAYGQGFGNVELCIDAMLACGRTRKQFKSDREIARWRRIDKMFAQGELDPLWVESRFGYARKHRWSLATLEGAILNTAKMVDWLRFNQTQDDEDIIVEGEEDEDTDYAIDPGS